jgi:hypothetical protein
MSKNKYSKSSKYINKNFKKNMPTIYTDKGKFNRDLVEEFKYALTQKNKDKCITYIQRAESFAWLSDDQLKEHCKQWRKLIKLGLITIRPENNFSKKLDKHEWYIFVVQSTAEDDNIDVAMLQLFDIAVSGYAYIFNKKENRDALFKYLTK